MPIFPNRFNELDRPPVRLGEARLALGSRRSPRISEITADEVDTVHPYSIFDRAWAKVRRSIALDISYRLQQVAKAIADFVTEIPHQFRVKARHRRAQLFECVRR